MLLLKISLTLTLAFDWEEVDCAPCPSNNYVTTVPRYAYVQQEMLTLCEMEVGSVASRYYRRYAELIDQVNITFN